MESRSLIRVLVVSTNETSSLNFVKTLTSSEEKDGFFNTQHKSHEISTYVRWLGCCKSLPGSTVADALIIIAKNQEEWDQLQVFVYEKRFIGFKILIFEEDIKNVNESITINLRIKDSDKNPQTILDEIVKFEEELENLLKKIFKTFDKKGDGFIDQIEMEQLCRELGVDVTQSEFQETLKSIDINHDGKISLEDFIDWWKNGRQASKLMESLINLKLATSSFLTNFVNSKYLSELKENVLKTQKENDELIHSFLSFNIEKQHVKTPEFKVALEATIGGRSKKDVSEAYASNFKEGFNSSHYYVCLEFTTKDSTKTEYLMKFLQALANTIRESLEYFSRKIFTFVNSNVSIKVFQKNENVICLSLKLRKNLKDQFVDFENSLHFFLDDEITQKLFFNIVTQCDIEKVKSNPHNNFVESFNFASVIEVKFDALKKNLKFLGKILKKFKNLPKFLNLLLNSYGGSHLEFNFNLDYLKSLKNSVLDQPNGVILGFLKNNLVLLIKEALSSFGGYTQFAKFYESVKDNLKLVINTPLIHSSVEIEFKNLHELF